MTNAPRWRTPLCARRRMRMPPFCSRAMATASQPASPKPLYSRLTSKSDALSAKARPSARAD